MAQDSSDNPLISQVRTCATHAGMWMAAGGVVLFVAGVFAGLTLEHQLMGQPPSADTGSGEGGAAATRGGEPDDSCEIRVPPIDPNIDPASSQMRDAVADRVRQILNLNGDQQHQVREIIEKYNPRMQEMLRRFEPEMRRLAFDALGDLRPVLNPEQREHLDRLLLRHARWLLRPSSRPALTSRDTPSGNPPQ